MKRAAAFTGLLLLLALPAGGAAQSDQSRLQTGFELYAEHCASCHGDRGRGVSPPLDQIAPGPSPGLGPPLVGVGALAADFYLRTGYMPLGHPGEQPRRKDVLFDESQIDALIAYIASLGPGPGIPEPRPERGNLSEGQARFAENCAGCHQIMAEGGYASGAVPPPLDRATPVQVAEAVRIGPYVMPRFTQQAISDDELDSLIAYVEYTKHPDDRGGWGIGHLGPVPEGMVTWLLAAVVLVATCVLIGERRRR